MADVLMDRIMDNARTRLPGAVDKNIYHEVQYVLDDFFKATGCWRERIEVEVYANTLTYEIESADLPSRVFALKYFSNGNRTPYAATLNDGNVLTLQKAIDAGTYYADVILTVTSRLNDEDYPRFPQWVADRYADAIADGLCGRLMAMPAKPYSSPQHALFFARKFRAAAQEVRTEVDRQNLVGGQNWLYPSFAAQR